MYGLGGIDKRLINGRFYFLFHDLEVFPGTANSALGRIDHPAHHEHWLLCHRDHLDEHDHVADREVAFERAPENDGVDTEEDHGHRQAAERVHRVPPARLRARGGDIAAVVLGKGIKLAHFSDERLRDFHLADDLGKAPIGDVDVFVFGLLKFQPAPRSQRGKPHINGK